MSNVYRNVTITVKRSTDPNVDNTIIYHFDDENLGVKRIEAHLVHDEAADDVESILKSTLGLACHTTEAVFEVETN